MSELSDELKNNLPEDPDERLDQLTWVILKARGDIILKEGTCDTDWLIMHMCKDLDLSYKDYLSLTVSVELNS
jgi:hypothetical protein